MKAVTNIKLPEKMASAQVKRIFKILQGNDKHPVILFVGGCVRNALLGTEVSDIDLATNLPPTRVMSVLKAAGVKVVPTGIDHGTVTAIIDQQEFQITTLRKDVETDGRRAVVAFTDDWREDALRRDFTLNTLLADASGHVFDPLGTGLKDLQKRKIVFVGEPAERIQEDYLRILRFFRFHAAYGKGQFDAGGFAACVKYKSKIKTLSKERVTQEFLKLLMTKNAGETLRLMVDHNILADIINSKFQELHFNYLNKIDKSKNSILCLLAVSGFSILATKRIEKNTRLSKFQLKQLSEALTYLKKFKTISDFDLKLLLYRLGHELAEIVLISRMMIEQTPVAIAKKWIARLKAMERPALPVRGQDFVDQGMKPGPDIKKALDRAERLWIRRGFSS